MKRSRMFRWAVAGIALAGFSVVGVGFTHMEKPDPNWTGGLHHATAVVKVDTRMKPDPEFGGG
ncbi:MAG TPA: hypothetical protein VGL02_16335 [Streptomyces sp.]